jgi:hypothetical protein
MPAAVRRLRRLSGWLSRAASLRFQKRTVVVRPALLSIPGVSDPFGSLRLYRISVLRDLVKARGKASVVENDGWAANAELLLRAGAYARRVEAATFTQRYDLRPRESRVRPWADARALFSFSRGAAALGVRQTAPSARRA